MSVALQPGPNRVDIILERKNHSAENHRLSPYPQPKHRKSLMMFINFRHDGCVYIISGEPASQAGTALDVVEAGWLVEMQKLVGIGTYCKGNPLSRVRGTRCSASSRQNKS